MALDKGDKTWARLFVQDCCCGRFHLWCMFQGRFDLGDLDPMSTDLELPVTPAEIIERSIGAPAREVPGSIEAIAIAPQ